MKSIVLQATAARSLGRIAETFRTAIAETLAACALGKACDTKAMTGTPAVRLRVGDYRAIFDETKTTISVLTIGHRRDIYR